MSDLRHDLAMIGLEYAAKGLEREAATITKANDRIEALESAQHGGEHGAAGDAIDFACDHCAPDEALAFMEDWRQGQSGEWPGYVKWLAVQRAGKAATLNRSHGDDNGCPI